MGYDTRLNGRIRIEPPLDWEQAQRHPLYVPPGVTHHHALVLVIAEHEEESSEGVLRRKQGVALEFPWAYPTKVYDILDELQRAVDFAPERAYTGEMEAEGSDFADIWKLAVIGGKATRLLPKIQWPDGTVHVNRRYEH